MTAFAAGTARPPPPPPLPRQLHPAARKKKPSLKTASEEEDATQRKQALSLKWQAYHQGGRGGVWRCASRPAW